MTNGLTSAATLAVLLLHAAFGCCWHHEHGCCAPTGSAGGHAVAGCGHDHDGHGHDHDGQAPHFHWGGEAPEPGHDHGDCASDLCQFVSPGAVDLPPVVAVWAGVSMADAWLASLLAAETKGAGFGLGNRRTRDAAPPVRALSRLCVWRV